MKNIKTFILAFIIASIAILGSAAAANVIGTNSLNSNLSTSTALANLSNVNSTKISNSTTIGSTLQVFHNVVSPISQDAYYIVLIIFAVVLIYGIITYESLQLEELEPGRRMQILAQIVLGSLMVLLIIPYIYIYTTYFPQIISSTAPNLLTLHSIVPYYIIYIDIFIAVIVSLIGFIFAMREFFNYIRTFSTAETTKGAPLDQMRSDALTRFIALTAFVFLSPFIIGIVFVLITQVFFSFSASVSGSLFVSLTSLSTKTVVIYNTNVGVCNPGIFGISTSVSCIESSLLYSVQNSLYGPASQAFLLNAAIEIMGAGGSALSQVAFEIIYDIILFFVMIYAFIKIDWYSLNYLSSLKTGENEAYNFNKLKRSYIQYIVFIFSPVIFILFLILINAISGVMLSIINYSSLNLMPPLINLKGGPTVSNGLLSFTGFIMAFYTLILLAFSFLVIVLKFIGAVIFAFGLYLFFDENVRYRIFGKNLLTVVVIIFLAPIILILIYSIFFGLIPSSLSSVFGYGNAQTITTTLNGWTASAINTTALNISQLSLFKSKANKTVTVSCINRASIQNAVNILSTHDPADSLGVLLGGCQNFVPYWSNGYEAMALIVLAILIGIILLLIFGGGLLAGLTGLGGEGAASLTGGLGLKAFTSIEGINKMHKTASANRLKYKTSIRKKHGSILRAITATASERVQRGVNKLSTSTLASLKAGEQLTYGYATAPLIGTALGSAISGSRKATISFAKSAISKTQERLNNERFVYVGGRGIRDYAKLIKRADESEKDALVRARRILINEYGASESGKILKIQNKDLNRFRLDKGFDILTTMVPEIKFDNKTEKDISRLYKLENEAIQGEIKYKKGEITKSEYDKIKKSYEILKERIDITSKRKGFENYEEVKNIRALGKDVMAVISPEGKTTKEIDIARKSIISVLSSYGANGSRVNAMLGDDIKSRELINTMALGLELINSGSILEGKKFIADAINTDQPTIGTKFKYFANGLGMSFNSEIMNPATNTLKDSYAIASDFAGKLKDYVFVSGIPLTKQYNDEITSLTHQQKILKEAGEDLDDKYKSGEITAQDYANQLSELSNMLLTLKAEEHKLTLVKDSIGKMQPFISKLVGKASMPSFAEIRKLASGEELARLEISKRMLENENRVTKKKIENLTFELNRARDDLKNPNISPYQKDQELRLINEINNKILTLNSEIKTRNTAYKNILNSAEAVKNTEIQKAKLNKVLFYNNIEKDVRNIINDEKNKDSLLKSIYESFNNLSNYKLDYDKLSSVPNAVLALNKINLDGINNIENIKQDKIANYNGYVDRLTEIKDGIKNGINNDIVNKVLGENSIEAKEAISGIKKEYTKIINTNLTDLISKLDESGDSEFINSLKKIKSTIVGKLLSESASIKYEDVKTELDKIISSSGPAVEEALKLGNEEQYNLMINEIVAASKESKITKDFENKLNNMVSELEDDAKNIGTELANEANKTLDDLKLSIEKIETENTKEDKHALFMAKMLTTSKVKDELESTDRLKFDFNIIKKQILKSLEENKTLYNLNAVEISALTNFSEKIFEREYAQKLVPILVNKILPEISALKYNKASEVINKLYNNIKSNNFDFEVPDNVRQLDEFTANTFISLLGPFFDQFAESITGEKRGKVGDRFRKARFEAFEDRLRRRRELEIDENQSNEENENKRELSDKSEDDDEIELGRSRRNINDEDDDE